MSTNTAIPADRPPQPPLPNSPLVGTSSTGTGVLGESNTGAGFMAEVLAPTIPASPPVNQELTEFEAMA
jgi:hypothetical protein